MTSAPLDHPVAGRGRGNWLPPLGVAAALALAGAAFVGLHSKLAEFFALQAALSASVLLGWAGRGRHGGWVALGVAGVLACMAMGALWANDFDVALAQIRGLPDACRRLVSL